MATYFKNRAFTLIEILITVIIVGIVASIAFSHFGVVIEKMKAKEAEHLLLVELASFKRDVVEDQVGTMVCPASDFIPVGQYFDVGVMGGGTANQPVCVFGAFRKASTGSASMSFISTCPGGGGVGYWGRGQADYVLYIPYEWCSPSSISIRCASGSNNPNICAEMGY